MTYQILKAIHIIFVVSYFAGLFYMVRLFVYDTEALELKNEKGNILHQQLIYMQERLWNIITLPAFIIMIISGFHMLHLTHWGFITQGWMIVKLVFVGILAAYHFWTWKTIRNLQKEKTQYTSVQLRMMNEVATIILFVVVFAVILKQSFMANWYWALISFVAMGALIMLIVKLVNRNKS